MNAMRKNPFVSSRLQSSLIISLILCLLGLPIVANASQQIHAPLGFKADLSSEHSQSGTPFQAEFKEQLCHQEHCIPKGATMSGVIQKVHSAGRFFHQGTLKLCVTTVSIPGKPTITHSEHCSKKDLLVLRHESPNSFKKTVRRRIVNCVPDAALPVILVASGVSAGAAVPIVFIAGLGVNIGQEVLSPRFPDMSIPARVMMGIGQIVHIPEIMAAFAKQPKLAIASNEPIDVIMPDWIVKSVSQQQSDSPQVTVDVSPRLETKAVKTDESPSSVQESKP